MISRISELPLGHSALYDKGDLKETCDADLVDSISTALVNRIGTGRTRGHLELVRPHTPTS
jgi:hypothetical protein